MCHSEAEPNRRGGIRLTRFSPPAAMSRMRCWGSRFVSCDLLSFIPLHLVSFNKVEEPSFPLCNDLRGLQHLDPVTDIAPQFFSGLLIVFASSAIAHTTLPAPLLSLAVCLRVATVLIYS